jgi:hypothetical protein
MGLGKRSQMRESFRLEKSALCVHIVVKAIVNDEKGKKGYRRARNIYVFMCMELMKNLHNNMPNGSWEKRRTSRGKSEKIKV